MRLPFDECLSPRLVHLARRRGHPEATHVRWLGLAGWQDHELARIAIDGDWTFVTKNSADFRGPTPSPGRGGQYAGIELHAGLVRLNGPVGMDLDMQLDLFAAVLDELERDPDLVNEVIEATLEQKADEIALRRYALPARTVRDAES